MVDWELSNEISDNDYADIQAQIEAEEVDEERLREMMSKKIADTVKCDFPGMGEE